MKHTCERCGTKPADKYVCMVPWNAKFHWHRYLCSACTHYLCALNVAQATWDLDGREVPMPKVVHGDK